MTSQATQFETSLTLFLKTSLKLKYSFFWDIVQCSMVFTWHNFGKNYQSLTQE